MRLQIHAGVVCLLARPSTQHWSLLNDDNDNVRYTAKKMVEHFGKGQIDYVEESGDPNEYFITLGYRPEHYTVEEIKDVYRAYR